MLTTVLIWCASAQASAAVLTTGKAGARCDTALGDRTLLQCAGTTRLTWASVRSRVGRPIVGRQVGGEPRVLGRRGAGRAEGAGLAGFGARVASRIVVAQLRRRTATVSRGLMVHSVQMSSGESLMHGAHRSTLTPKARHRSEGSGAR